LDDKCAHDAIVSDQSCMKILSEMTRTEGDRYVITPNGVTQRLVFFVLCMKETVEQYLVEPINHRSLGFCITKNDFQWLVLKMRFNMDT
jgi:hypothetical protein